MRHGHYWTKWPGDEHWEVAYKSTDGAWYRCGTSEAFDGYDGLIPEIGAEVIR